MVSTLKKKGAGYFCSNCMMRQPDDLRPNCIFCGNEFSNLLSIMRENFKEKQDKEMFEYESNIHGRD